MINQNEVARNVALDEGKKIQVNIAQIKEVMKCLLYQLGNYSDKDIIKLVDKIAGQGGIDRGRWR
jgi:hypothetical protein